ncbi:MAG: hypothetical protein DRJ29_15885 [Bacteroidetes bacterium]|nr:MAG: hypothetical protein DRJ29_15885 [Bacteroidota bacterium]
MNSSTLTPEESLLLITKTIEETKERFKEYGSVFIFWGSLMLIVFGSQLVLSLLELYKFTIVPVYLFPIGAIITAIWAWKDYKKTNKPKTIIGNILQNIGWVIGMNLMIMGFLFSSQLGDAMGPVFIILLALMIIVSGLSIKFRPLTIGGALLNLIGLGSFFIDSDYHGFSMMLGAVVGMIIPGILLNIARRKENV